MLLVSCRSQNTPEAEAAVADRAHHITVPSASVLSMADALPAVTLP